MIHLELIGYPLGHSLSPKIHTAALKACGLEGKYSLFPIHPDDKQGLESLLNQVRAKQIYGLNVTIPHKQNVIEFMNELTPTAKSIGAVNTIYLKDEKLIGDNTDALGFLADLKNFIGNRELEIGKSVLVIGAGGSARAVVYALLNDGWNVTISSRRIEQSEQLANSFSNYPLSIIHSSNLPTFQFSNFQLIVNTTPIGMTPNINESPLPENLSLPSNVFIYDLVYNPRETKLVRDARLQGLNSTTGLGMLIEQAALAFETWTGFNPPREILWQAVET
ncbi:MAG TPA: shikimate dehydrogenase [Anaerolineae bacterium]|nr:shikimate dehydrogenase [Anaerolineae bacterium]